MTGPLEVGRPASVMQGRFGRGLLVVALVGWHVNTLRHQGDGISKLEVFTHCSLHLESGTFLQQRAKPLTRTHCEAEEEGSQSTASKMCSKCRSLLPVDEFQRRSRSADGLQSCCRKCMNEYNKMRRQDRKAANKNRSRPPDDEQVFCPRCQRTLRAAEFSSHLMSPNRLLGQCRACVKLHRLKNVAANGQRPRPASFPVPSTFGAGRGSWA